MVHQLDLVNNKVSLALTEEDDDADEEALTKPATLVKIDITMSALANARSFYTQKKAAAVKTAKTLAAAEHTIKAAEKKAAAAVAQIKVKATIRSMRTPFWFEKFDWFVSSENLLVLCARDAQQAEMLVRRHLRANDAYVHADVNGAPLCVVKANSSAATSTSSSAALELPPLTLSQAGCAVLSRSDGWSNRVVTSAWYVRADAVTKEDGHGGRLPTGVFNVRKGCSRVYLPPSPPVMGFGVLFRVGLSSVAGHVDERKVRGGVNDAVEEVEEEATVEVEEEEDDDDEEAEGTTLRMLPGGGFRVAAAEPTTTTDAPAAKKEEAAVVDVADPTPVAERSLDDIDGPDDNGKEEDDGDGDTASISTTTTAAANKPNRLTAKQRRQLKKGKPIGGEERPSQNEEEDGEDLESEPPLSARDGGGGGGGGGGGRRKEERTSDTESVASSVLPSASVRGKAGKMKKLKGKYADQDDEDRELYMDLLGSAGKSKKQLEKEKKAVEAQQKAAEAEAKKERHAARQAREREKEVQREAQRAAGGGKKQPKGGGGGGGGGGEDGNEDGGGEGGGGGEEDDEVAVEVFAELEALLSEESIQSPRLVRPPSTARIYSPRARCRPTRSCSRSCLCAVFGANLVRVQAQTDARQPKAREGGEAGDWIIVEPGAAEGEDLMRALTDNELVCAMLGSVKVQAPAKLLQQQKSAEKRERKERATERNEQKAGAKKKEGEAVES